MQRILVLAAISTLIFILVNIFPQEWITPAASPTLSLGFLLLGAYIIAVLLARTGFPKITGYIIGGMLFGPSMLGFLSSDVLSDLKLVDDLALTFIAFAAGGELRITMLKDRKKSILLTLISLIVIVLFGVTFSLLSVRSFFPLTMGMPFLKALAVAAICGVIAVARSPSSAIAIISETKASGPFTEMVLGVTVAVDVLTIFLFAVVLSFSEVILAGATGFDFVFLLGIGLEVSSSLIFGFLLGRAIVYYLKHIRSNLTIFILGVAFLVTKLAQSLAWLLDTEFGIHFHLEPMIICLTAGFVVQNMSRLGDDFLRIIDRSSLPIYAVFFAISGASLGLEALKETWHWALFLVAIRLIFIYTGTYVGGKLASDPPRFIKASGLGFVTQAGVSLGLAKLVAERFPDFGAELAALIVATIAINQVIGPAAFKWALSCVGESKS
jgi:Kef-type K+ transport system membrane component KefB